MMMGANAPVQGDAVSISWLENPIGADLDICAYLLDASGKVLGDEGMVFYGQTQVPGVGMAVIGKSATFQLDYAAIPDRIERIALCAVLDTGKASAADLAQAKQLTMAMGQLSFTIDLAGKSEKALIIGEVYKRNGAYKLRAVGQGFDGGLMAIATHFGVNVQADPSSSAPPPAAPAPAPAPTRAPEPSPAAAPAASTISLKKVTLAKAEKVSLAKAGGAIRALLSWEGRGAGEGDLDFYCFYVTKDGKSGKVYWKDLGSSASFPFIAHSGDALRAGEEAIVIERPETLRYALFAAYSAVKNGAGSFASYRPKMTLTDQAGNEVTIPLLNPNDTSYWVAISHLSLGETVDIEHIETYGKNGFPHMIAAERAPRLHPDGSWDVSKGEIEFKK